jgi:hypothetical protein
MAVEEGEEQSADVRAVDIGIGHDDHLVVAEPGAIELVVAACLERSNDGSQLFVDHDLFLGSLLHVQYLALQGENSLKGTVPSLLGRAAGRGPLNQVNLAFRRILVRTIGQLAGQGGCLEAVPLQYKVTGLARRLSGPGSGEALLYDGLGLVRVLLQV